MQFKFIRFLFVLMNFDRKKFEFKKSDAPLQTYQLKITLRDTRPPIWRRLLVSNYISFRELHEAIQDSFYWSNYHLHEFTFCPSELQHSRVQIVPEPEEGLNIAESIEFGAFIESEIRLCDVFSPKQTSVCYRYDFGDNWEHDIRLEKILPNKKGLKSFICVGGKQVAPPEDCGGVYGYHEMREILEDPGHPEYEETKNWLDDEFNAEKIRCPMTKMSPKTI